MTTPGRSPIVVALVAAVAENNVIGADGDLAWKISDDLKWFKKVTLGKPVIMGRKTYDSIGRVLPGRDNIVVTRAPDFICNGGFVVRCIDDALRLATICATHADVAEICVIGGGEIYKQFINRADRLYVTQVRATVAGDTFFPKIEPDNWRTRRVGGCDQSATNAFACDFFVMERTGR